MVADVINMPAWLYDLLKGMDRYLYPLLSNKIEENHNHLPMPSSVISFISYDVTTATLRIIFVSGRIYDYKNVPEAVYNEMKAAFSKGTYFNGYIKDSYIFERVN